MNDFSELENELKKLRPAQPSPVLFERVEQALEDCRAGALEGTTPARSHYNWWCLGFGLAAAGIVVLFSVISFEREHKLDTARVAQSSPASEMRPEASETEWVRYWDKASVEGGDYTVGVLMARSDGGPSMWSTW